MKVGGAVAGVGAVVDACVNWRPMVCMLNIYLVVGHD